MSTKTPPRSLKRVSFNHVVDYNSPPKPITADLRLPTPRAARSRLLTLPDAENAGREDQEQSTARFPSKKCRCRKKKCQRRECKRRALSDRTNDFISSFTILPPEEELKQFKEAKPIIASRMRTGHYCVVPGAKPLPDEGRRLGALNKPSPDASGRSPKGREALAALEQLRSDGALAHMKRFVTSALALREEEEAALDGMLDALDAARVHGLYAMARGGDCGLAMLRRAELEERRTAALLSAARRGLHVLAIARVIGDERRRLRYARARLMGFVAAQEGKPYVAEYVCDEERAVRALAMRILASRREGW